MLIDIRCKHCQKLHCRISRNFFGVVEFKCDKCKQVQTISLASTMRPTKPRTNADEDSPPSLVSATIPR